VSPDVASIRGLDINREERAVHPAMPDFVAAIAANSCAAIWCGNYKNPSRWRDGIISLLVFVGAPLLKIRQGHKARARVP
jgi:hypothetical protein